MEFWDTRGRNGKVAEKFGSRATALGRKWNEGEIPSPSKDSPGGRSILGGHGFRNLDADPAVLTGADGDLLRDGFLLAAANDRRFQLVVEGLARRQAGRFEDARL